MLTAHFMGGASELAELMFRNVETAYPAVDGKLLSWLRPGPFLIVGCTEQMESDVDPVVVRPIVMTSANIRGYLCITHRPHQARSLFVHTLDPSVKKNPTYGGTFKFFQPEIQYETLFIENVALHDLIPDENYYLGCKLFAQKVFRMLSEDGELWIQTGVSSDDIYHMFSRLVSCLIEWFADVYYMSSISVIETKEKKLGVACIVAKKSASYNQLALQNRKASG